MAVNAQERTVGQFVDLVDGTGWKIESISRSPKSALSLLIFTAVWLSEGLLNLYSF